MGAVCRRRVLHTPAPPGPPTPSGAPYPQVPMVRTTRSGGSYLRLHRRADTHWNRGVGSSDAAARGGPARHDARPIRAQHGGPHCAARSGRVWKQARRGGGGGVVHGQPRHAPVNLHLRVCCSCSGPTRVGQRFAGTLMLMLLTIPFPCHGGDFGYPVGKASSPHPLALTHCVCIPQSGQGHGHVQSVLLPALHCTARTIRHLVV
mmetsp:Transcript_21265/g.52517  ORF Transcript_21265/g.52517 Transcript_21265/m.52517 type:complete len:205 (-) Transcript_21265:109-723(-)